MPKMDPAAAPDPPRAHPCRWAYDRTQAYDAKLAALGQQANSSCFTEMADATFFAQRPHLSKQQVLFALVRRQIIGTMLSRLLLADGWRCQFALFDGRGRPLVPLGLEVGEIMDRLMEDPESSSDQLAIHFRQPGQDRADIVVLRCEYTGPAWTVLSLDPACYGALAPIAAQALQFPAWMRQGGSVAPCGPPVA
jgi:hypothetical protein